MIKRLLTPELWRLIYEYDTTYRDHMRNYVLPCILNIVWRRYFMKKPIHHYHFFSYSMREMNITDDPKTREKCVSCICKYLPTITIALPNLDFTLEISPHLFNETITYYTWEQTKRWRLCLCASTSMLWTDQIEHHEIFGRNIIQAINTERRVKEDVMDATTLSTRFTYDYIPGEVFCTIFAVITLGGGD